ncbi:hypothetical protein BKN14_00540 [Candidatus Gracilibacteria bacterium HOT-871]|nr:hypothetical protein BKN14_00540 [Candidatus Gracilibacteria bacterium HOT-871]
MESIVLPFSYEDKQEELSLKVYSDLLKTTFKSIAWQVGKKDFEQKIFEENLKFYDFSDTINHEHLDYLLFEEKLLYEVFTVVNIERVLDLDKILLEKILSGELKICFVNGPDKVAILNRGLSVSNKVENILIQ